MKQTTTTRLPVARNPTALGKMTEAESVTMEEKANKHNPARYRDWKQVENEVECS